MEPHAQEGPRGQIRRHRELFASGVEGWRGTGNGGRFQVKKRAFRYRREAGGAAVYSAIMRIRMRVEFLLNVVGLSADWPLFRGPNGSGIGESLGLAEHSWRRIADLRDPADVPEHLEC